MNQGQTRVLVTGATGLLGRRLIQKLAERGMRVRALARRPAAAGGDFPPGVEAVCGDVADAASLRGAFQGIQIVVHAAADTGGTEEGAGRTTIQGTRYVLDLCKEHGIRKLVYISTLNVYGVCDLNEGAVVDEDAPLERHPERRGFYTWGKIAAERFVLEAIEQGRFPIVCLRPGTILGTDGEVFTPMMGFRAGEVFFLVIGQGGFVLPLVYLDNLVDAIIAAIEAEKSSGGVFNVVAPETVNKRQYVEGFLKKLYPKAIFVFIPYWVFHVAVRLQEGLLKAVGKQPFLTHYRLISSQRNIIYDSSRIRRELGWTPPYTIDDAFAAMISHSRKTQPGR
jgi:nucleoside-diphosphate-sugar epimerase